MSASPLLPALALVALLAAGQANQDTFTCARDSPVSGAVWSATKPKLALTHIFCGQITANGDAEGFHSRPDGHKPPCARPTGDKIPLGLCIDCYPGEEVYDNNKKKWVERGTPCSNKFCFFPGDWSIKKTTYLIVSIYNKCGAKTGDTIVCKRDYRGPGGNLTPFDVIIFLDNNSPKRIVTAFATPRKEYNHNNCHTNC